MNERERLAEFLGKIRPADVGEIWDAVLKRAGELETCEGTVSPDTRALEWRLPEPWRPIRVPDDMADIQGMTSEDAPSRAFQNHEGDTLQLFLLPAGLPVQNTLLDDGDIPGGTPESRCARVFSDCAIVITQWRIEIFGEVGSMATAIVVARTGDLLLASINSSDIGRRDRMIAAVCDLAQRGLAPAPVPSPDAVPTLAVRLHNLYGSKPLVWEISERRPRDTSFVEQEGRDALALYSLDRIRTHWYFPQDVDPELVRIHQEEAREYAEEIVIFRLGEIEQMERNGRSTMLTFVVENTGDVPASGVRVKLTFPAHVLAGSFGTVYAPRIQPPEYPQIFQLGPGVLKRRRTRIARTIALGDLAEAAREDGWDSYENHPDGRVTTYRVERVRARAAPNLTRTCMMFRRWEDVAPLTIRWEVSAERTTTRGTLEVGARIRALEP